MLSRKAKINKGKIFMLLGIAFMFIEYCISHFIVQAFFTKDTLGFCSYNSQNNEFTFVYSLTRNAEIKIQGFEVNVDSSYFIRRSQLLL